MFMKSQDYGDHPQGVIGYTSKKPYKQMWESLKSAKCKGDKALEVSLKALIKDIEEKYSK